MARRVRGARRRSRRHECRHGRGAGTKSGAGIGARSGASAPDPAEALRALGISVSGPTVSVGTENTLADLRALPFKVRGFIPAQASALVERIVELLLDTLPRITADIETDAFSERTATVYLPETLRAYLALPTSWARDHVYPDGSTPDSALISQLGLLEQAVARMHESALRGDANALLINGRLLDYRFGGTKLTS